MIALYTLVLIGVPVLVMLTAITVGVVAVRAYVRDLRRSAEARDDEAGQHAG